jgi:hypothetical protein
MLIERPSSDMPNSEQQLRPNNSQSDNQAFELKLLCYSEKLFLFYQLAPSENLIFSRAPQNLPSRGPQTQRATLPGYRQTGVV